ncbi:nicotinate-nucleotide adenylyltransferase [Brevibacillus sp. H7]|jgi:nicotinate-nucleotide adenylyltransferase|uniref:nicotinate-nucleotide adenylyltransferase n=1 Tax=Brevibacillus sp. H7 TaxID=3349138 RepID=UPI0038004CA7
MSVKAKQIGIMGGTFDPIHCGHLLAAEQAREQARLDEVWFMPARIPPHKERAGITAQEHRLRMVELAVADHPSFRVTDVELLREGPSYTYDTMCQLIDTYPDCQFSFIIGGDMVEMLPKWYRISDLIQMVRFIGLARPGSNFDPSAVSSSVTFVEMPTWELSSTLVRERAAAGRSLRYLVPAAVESYIREQGLYESIG